jgi:hypothetical protein
MDIHVINDSFYAPALYKQVITLTEYDKLPLLPYPLDPPLNSACPITQFDFVTGVDIIKLPCQHCYDPPAIKKWLLEEKGECPVCRYQFETIEVKIAPEFAPENAPENAIANAYDYENLTYYNAHANDNDNANEYNENEYNENYNNFMDVNSVYVNSLHVNSVVNADSMYANTINANSIIENFINNIDDSNVHFQYSLLADALSDNYY